MQFNTNTLDASLTVDGIVLDNVNDFCYLGHTIFNDKRNSTELRISKATGKFHELENVLCDHEIHLPIRKKYLEACVRPRLCYATPLSHGNQLSMKLVNLRVVGLDF